MEELADRIIALLQNPELARAMGERGMQRVRGTFTWENAAVNWFRQFLLETGFPEDGITGLPPLSPPP
ncbi:hypothetical protein D3C75_675710 [compost metagenome]